MSERDLFIAALQIDDPEGRSAYLDEACGADAELRQRVEALLRAFAQAGSFLQQPAENPGATSDLGPAGADGNGAGTEAPGAVIGPYKLLEQIGEGGMGTVWMAQQAEPVKRLVALKVIRPGMDSKQVVVRFEAERQALALMDHPNIAKVHDGGTTATGRPYFVMELVKGAPITKYCDEQRLTPRQRLELFVPVCQAVQHAHQKGIIHRDLKPSNVLVGLYDGRPLPKVIDFGVAKAAGQQLTDKTLVTGFGAVVGTLEYMSPEQAKLDNLDIDTRSDVYSLGVLLYELLTGTTPLDRKRLKEAAMLEVLRLIREEEPPRPSTRLNTTDELPSVAANRGLEPKKLSGLVRGELDWLVMKALEKDRNRRYESANAFAMDLQRYLADEPVQACPPSAWYRFRKFARRNKGRLAVAALVLLFLASLGGVAAWAAKDRMDRAQEAAVQQAAQRAAQESDIGRDLDAARAFCREDRLREASAVVDHAQALVARGGADPDLGRRVGQARSDVDMAARLEKIRLERRGPSTFEGDPSSNSGAALYQDAFREYGLDVMALDAGAAAERIRASAIKDQLLAALEDWQEYPARDERLMAVLRRADADPWRERFRDAFERYFRGRPTKKALEDLKDLARDPALPAQPPAVVVSAAQALLIAGDRPLAVEVLRSAQRRRPGDFWINYRLAGYLGDMNPPRADEAMRCYQAAVALRPDLGPVHTDLGVALDKGGDLSGAAAEYQRAIALPPEAAMPHYNLGILLGKRGDLPAAIAEYKKAIALYPKYIEARRNLGKVLAQTGDQSGAVAEYKKAIDLAPQSATEHWNLGLLLLRQGQFRQALEEVRRAHGLGLKVPGRSTLPTAEWVRNCERLIELDAKLPTFMDGKASASAPERIEMAQLCLFKGLNGAAAHFCAEAFVADPKLADDPNPGNRFIAACAAALAGCGRGKDVAGLGTKARSDLRRQALAWLRADLEAWGRILEKEPDKAHPAAGRVLQNWLEEPSLAAVRRPEALAQLPETERQAWQQFWTDVANLLAKPYHDLGATLRQLGWPQQAQAAYREALAILEHQTIRLSGMPPCRDRYLQAAHELAEFLLSSSQAAEADTIYRDEIATLEKLAAANPKRAENREEIGRLCIQLGQWHKAITAYTQALEIQPKRWELWSGRGRARLEMQQWDECIADYTRAIELAPDVHTNWFHRGLAYMRQGKWDGLVADYSKLLEKYPNDSNVLYARAVGYAQLQQPEQAMADLRQAVAKGYKDLRAMQYDNRLAPLRSREDFKKLLAEVESKAKSKLPPEKK